MKVVIVIAIAFFTALPGMGQDSWIMLEEYPSPGQGARGIYYSGKVLYNVDNEAQTIFTLSPYNLEVIDIYPSPVDQPWGITFAHERFWLTNFGWSTSQLVKMQEDTFLVDEEWDFEDWYFYGLTSDSVNHHLWIAAMNHGYSHYLLEFDGEAGQVVQWHPWSGNWPLGMQYWDDQVWVNSSTWTYPDFTYILELESWNYDEMLICPLAVPEGIATNGAVWWISHFRNNAPYIWKLLPPGWDLHDITWYSPQDPPSSGTLEDLILIPQAQFMNYGQYTENDVPFFCVINEIHSGEEVYADSLIYPSMNPEEIVEIVFRDTVLEPDMEYEIIFYADLLTDDYRENDTLKLEINTIGMSLHDLAVMEILAPEEVEPFEIVYPALVVINQGDFFEPTAPVHLEIEHPDGTITEYNAQVTNLEINETDTVNFAPFNPPEEGMYIFRFDGMLPLDAIPENDYAVLNCQIGRIHDVAPVEIICPGEFEPMETMVPEVIVENLGEFDESWFHVSCMIEDSTMLMYQEQVSCYTLAAGEQREILFNSFTPPYPADYTFTFATLLAVDGRPENDTLEILTQVVTAVESGGEAGICEFQVEGGFPNPFNAQTSFTIHIPEQSIVHLNLYNLEGRVVSSYDFGLLGPGVHQQTINAADLPSGIYIASIEAGMRQQSIKVVLLK